MPVSPRIDSEGVLRLTVQSNGTPLADTVRVISAVVQRGVNQVPSARLVIADGDVAADGWPVSDSADLVPGAAIRISAGYGSDERPIFEGIVVKVGIQVTGDNDSRLLVECRDKVVGMTVGRKNANFVDMTDSDIITTLAEASGLAVAVDSTAVAHRELVQYYCTDWDFMVSRAEVNGLLVIADDGKLSVKAPDVSSEPVLAVSYGSDLIEFQAEMDARSQWTEVQAVAWSPEEQTVLQGTAAPATLNAQGNLTSATLAEALRLPRLRLQTPSPLEAADLAGWSKAQQVKDGLARIRGRMKFQGHAGARPGASIEVSGVGARYSGDVFVGAVTHDIRDGNWITEVEFGLAPDGFAERRDLVAPPASGWLPGAEGLQIGKVLKLDGDPAGQHRIQVELPLMQARTPGVWARLAQLHASSAFGAFFVPEVGDEVVVGYFNNDPSHPVILGSLYSGSRKPPYALEAPNDIKAIVTRCMARIEINDEHKVITVTTPALNRIVLSDQDRSIVLTDQNDNRVELGPDGITLDSPNSIRIGARGGMSIDAVGALSISSKADVKVEGLNVHCEARVGIVARGSATAELSASGQTTVKGALVMIN
jgi:Rhs element Vgr protein